MGFGKLWKLKMSFSRSSFGKFRNKFQNGCGKVLDFCLEKFYKYSEMDVARCRVKHRKCYVWP